MKNRKKLTGARAVGLLRYLPLILWVAFFVFAFGWIVLASFSTTKEIFSNGLLQSGVHVENYTGVWERNHVAHYFVNSLITTGIPCVLIILIAAPAAYVLSKKTFFGRKQTFNAFVVGMSIPQVMLVIPIYCWFVKANLVGHLSTLVILYTTLNLPYTVYFVTPRIVSPSIWRAVGRSNSTVIDGCSEMKAMWKVMIPMASPGIITVTIFNFMNIWNEYFMALIFANGNDKIRTLSMGLQNMITSMKYTGDWAGLVAGVIIVLVPTLILYLLLSEKIVAGITGGAVKG